MPLLTGGTRRPRWHRLTVAAVEPVAEHAVALTLTVPPDLAEVFAHEAGQYLTLRAEVAGTPVQQSYSICVPPTQARAEGVLRIGVGRVEGGRLSTLLTTGLAPGDVLDVLPPLGDFTCLPVPGASRHHAFLAAGSGITPVLALLPDLLDAEPGSQATVVDGNRSWARVMFRAGLADLERRYGDRLRVVHVLTREAEDPTPWAGRLEGALLEEVLAEVAPVGTVDEWFVCGSPGMVEGAVEHLRDAGADPAHVHHEAFTATP